MIKAEDVREMTDLQIDERVKELREELFKLRFRGATQQLENPSLIKSIRRDIARLKTVARERELGAQVSE